MHILGLPEILVRTDHKTGNTGHLRFQCQIAIVSQFLTAGFLIHGRHAQIFGQNFDQIFGQVFDQRFWPGFGGQKIQCTVLPGQRNTV